MILAGGSMIRSLAAAAFLSLVLGPLSAAPAQLTGLEGEVSVVRSGVLIPSEKVGEGLVLEPFDRVVTGATGRAEIRLSADLGLAGAVRLERLTTVTLDFAADGSRAVVDLALVTGRLAVALNAQSRAVVQIRTENLLVTGAVPGFRVLSTDEGDLLVTSSAAPVQCRVSDRVLRADGTAAVELLARDGGLHSLPVTADTLGAFEAAWAAQRRQVFRDQPAESFRIFAARYQRLLGAFGRAWDRYQRESRDEPRGQLASAAQLRRTALPLDRVLAPVRELRRLAAEGLIPASLELSRGYPAREFFRQADVDEAQLWPRLAAAGGLYRAAAVANGGRFPEAADGSAVTVNSPYFQ